jgi:hypothetical protein
MRLTDGHVSQYLLNVFEHVEIHPYAHRNLRWSGPLGVPQPCTEAPPAAYSPCWIAWRPYATSIARPFFPTANSDRPTPSIL